MPVTQQIDASSGDILILVGTMKGAFILRADASAAERGRSAVRTFPAAPSTRWLRRPRRTPSPLGRAAQHALGRAAPLERRLRRNLDAIPRRRT